MRKFLIPALILSAVTITAPAAAQRGNGYGQNHRGAGIERQIDQMERQIDRLHDRYRRNGLSLGEHRDLLQRIQNLRQSVRYERREGRNERW